ncbi:MAG: dihydroorotase [Myxococcota bacterium]|nr:dihydroorotase [Myxococcota bacterium]
MSMAIVNGRVLDPGLELDGHFDILIQDGIIQQVAPKGQLEAKADQTHDASGHLVIPGLTDLRVHVREPGQEYKEDIQSASEAAVAGGFTTIVAAPSGPIAMDTPEMVEHVIRRGKEVGLCAVEAATSITQGRRGDVLTEVATTKRAGAKIVCEGARTIASAQLMRSALEYATDFELTIMAYAQEATLADAGHMHEGVMSTCLGLRGIPRAAESTIVNRDIALAELTGAKLHLSQITCAESVAMIRDAKKRGVNVSADVSPNHLVFIDKNLSEFDTNLKLEPPLREPSDRDALWAGLADGTIDAIATGHAPQTMLEKDQTFASASTGALGLQTALSAVLTAAKGGPASMEVVIKAFTQGASLVLRNAYEGIAEGASASLVVVDLEVEWTLKPEDIKSKSKNSPMTNRPLRGRVEKTFFDGRLVYSS